SGSRSARPRHRFHCEITGQESVPLPTDRHLGRKMARDQSPAIAADTSEPFAALSPYAWVSRIRCEERLHLTWSPAIKFDHALPGTLFLWDLTPRTWHLAPISQSGSSFTWTFL